LEANSGGYFIGLSSWYGGFVSGWFSTLPDGKYMVYRFVATLPFTLLLCWYYYRKRNPLPVMVGHFLVNLPAVIQMVAISFMAGAQ